MLALVLILPIYIGTKAKTIVSIYDVTSTWKQGNNNGVTENAQYDSNKNTGFVCNATYTNTIINMV